MARLEMIRKYRSLVDGDVDCVLTGVRSRHGKLFPDF